MKLRRRAFRAAAGWSFARTKRSSSRPSGVRAGTHRPASSEAPSLRYALPRIRDTQARTYSSFHLTISNSPSHSRGAFFAPGALHLCFAHPNRGVDVAPRDVRVRARHPLGLHVTRQARRLRGALRPMTRDAFQRSNADAATVSVIGSQASTAYRQRIGADVGGSVGRAGASHIKMLAQSQTLC